MFDVEIGNVDVGKRKIIAQRVGKGHTFAPSKNNNTYAMSLGVKCYRCGEVDHYFNNVLNRR